jgi:hypothetical protein
LCMPALDKVEQLKGDVSSRRTSHHLLDVRSNHM